MNRLIRLKLMLIKDRMIRFLIILIKKLIYKIYKICKIYKTNKNKLKFKTKLYNNLIMLMNKELKILQVMKFRIKLF